MRYLCVYLYLVPQPFVYLLFFFHQTLVFFLDIQRNYHFLNLQAQREREIEIRARYTDNNPEIKK